MWIKMEWQWKKKNKNKYAKLLPSDDSRWKLYKCLLYYSFNFFVYLNIYKWSIRGKKVVSFEICLQQKILKKNKMAHNSPV